MTGMAQKLFKDKTGREALYGKNACKVALQKWNFLNHLIQNYGINPVDVKIAETLLKNYSLKSESAAAFIAHLSKSAKNGHLLVKLEEGKILPSVKSLWLKEAEITDGDLEALEKLVLNGFEEISSDVLYAGLFAKTDEKFSTSYLCKIENTIYFQRYFNFETSVLENLMHLDKSTPSVKLNISQIDLKLQSLIQDKTLLKEQAEAILMAANKSVTFISGGPGTGKTYTAGFIIQVILESLSEVEKANFKIAIAAPTGKAASNLQNSLKNLTGVQAKTLHTLLGLRETGQSKNQSFKTLNADFVLVDESSMIDVAMMSRLLQAVKKGARIVFLGDPHQLPSVDAGSMFLNLIQAIPQNCVELKVCLRAELEEIVEFAKAINEGMSETVFKMLLSNSAVTRLSNSEMRQELIFEEGFRHFPLLLKKTLTPDEILNSFNRFRILSPLRKGAFGVDALNHYFFDHLVGKNLKNHSLMIPIMLCRNDAKLGLFNGEVGVLILHANNSEKDAFQLNLGDYALFPCKTNGFRQIPALILPQYEYAYVLSVHKSQGSEFDKVLVLLPDGAECFGREVLYTAVTRAKKSLQIYGSDDVIQATIKNKTVRLSGLLSRIKA